jgi:hypothetical protein
MTGSLQNPLIMFHKSTCSLLRIESRSKHTRKIFAFWFDSLFQKKRTNCTVKYLKEEFTYMILLTNNGNKIINESYVLT